MIAMAKDEPRPTLGELARETRDAERASGGMKCPKCDCRDTRVIKTRHNVDGTETSRRRVCRNCGHRLTTVEISL
jgi:Zn ribbon nucleic-acid-binding protein